MGIHRNCNFLIRIDLENNTLQLYIDRYKFNEQSIMIPVINGDISRNFNLNDPLFIGGTPQYTFLKWREKLNSYHGFQVISSLQFFLRVIRSCISHVQIDITR